MLLNKRDHALLSRFKIMTFFKVQKIKTSIAESLKFIWKNVNNNYETQSFSSD